MCIYWSRKLDVDGSNHAITLCQGQEASEYGTVIFLRFFGLPIRPVAKKVGYEFDEGSVDNMDMNDFDDDWK